MTSPRDDQGIIGNGKAVIDGHSMPGRRAAAPGRQPAGRLEALLLELVRIHGQKGAAKVLDVGYQTLRRSLQAGQLSPRLLLALEHYDLLRERERRSTAVAANPEAQPEGQDPRLARLETIVTDLTLRMDRLEAAVAPTLAAGTDNDRVSIGDGIAIDPVRGVVHGTASTDEGTMPADGETAALEGRDNRLRDPDKAGTLADWDDLLKKWRHMRILESAARTRLERAVARERTLQVEMALIWEHDSATPLTETWKAINRDSEWEWRWRALSEASRERRRLARRRDLRRLLTLGLWR